MTKNLYVLISCLLMSLCVQTVRADITVEELDGEDLEQFNMFRHLFTSDSDPQDFYDYTARYEKILLDKGYMMLYYKLKNNQGFYALRHNQLLKAVDFAKELEARVHEDKAKEYYYLPIGLMGDIYYMSHNTRKAEANFLEAIKKAGDRDPKFTTRTYHSLSEMLSLTRPEKAMEWADKALDLSQKTDNLEYTSLSLAMKGYVSFLMGNAKTFYEANDRYMSLKSRDFPEFNHRYDKVMDAARMAFEHDYQGALAKIREGGLAVDSSLMVIRVLSMNGEITKGFEAMRRRYIELDSIYSVIQQANFDEIATERSLIRSREEADANKRLVRKLTNWLIGMTIVFLFIYLMGRRRLMKKIFVRNRALKMAVVRAEEGDRMKMSFIRNMSHEIRTPLNAVAGFSQVLCQASDDMSPEEKKDIQQRILTNVEQITDIVSEVLELSKSESEIESRDAEMEKSNVFCNVLCRQLIASVNGKTPAAVVLQYSTAVPDDFVIRTNGPRLTRALAHLLDNAQKFTEVGTIELACHRYGKTVQFSVSDTGVGIDPADSERIFENFQKVNDFKEGIGLGLPICRRLITSLGGTVVLDTEYKRGSRFVVTLPL